MATRLELTFASREELYLSHAGLHREIKDAGKIQEQLQMVAEKCRQMGFCLPEDA